MKDETGGVVLEEFVALKLKMYSFFVGDNVEQKKDKGCELKCWCDNKSQWI